MRIHEPKRPPLSPKNLLALGLLGQPSRITYQQAAERLNVTVGQAQELYLEASSIAGRGQAGLFAPHPVESCDPLACAGLVDERGLARGFQHHFPKGLVGPPDLWDTLSDEQILEFKGVGAARVRRLRAAVDIWRTEVVDGSAGPVP